MRPELTWNYERDACWGPAGEPLLSAWLRSEDLLLRLRNSRQYGIEVVVGVLGGGSIDDESPGSVMKLGFHREPPKPLAVRVQSGRQLAFVEDVRTLVAALNCANRVQLHLRPRGGGVWWTLEGSIDDLQLDRLLEPASGLVLRYAPPAPVPCESPARELAAEPSAVRSPHRPGSQPAAAQPATSPEDSAAAQMIGAVAPVAAWMAGAKLAEWMFSPDKRR